MRTALRFLQTVIRRDAVASAAAMTFGGAALAFDGAPLTFTP